MTDLASIDAFVVAAHLTVALACWLRGQSAVAPAHARFWRLAAIVLLALAAVKHFGGVEAITGIGREVARTEGWYAVRRPWQRWFVFGTALAGLGAMAALLRRLRPVCVGVAIALSGLVWLVFFVLVQLASAHRVDVFLARAVFGVRTTSLFEFAGIALVTLGAAIWPTGH